LRRFAAGLQKKEHSDAKKAWDKQLNVVKLPILIFPYEFVYLINKKGFPDGILAESLQC
jgi:hypothetical protein